MKGNLYNHLTGLSVEEQELLTRLSAEARVSDNWRTNFLEINALVDKGMQPMFDKMNEDLRDAGFNVC